MTSRRECLGSVIGIAIGAKWGGLRTALAAERGSDVATEAVKLPWDGNDSIIPNLTIGSVRDSLLIWLNGARDTPVENYVWVNGGNGVHAATLMVAVGALAGFAGQTAAFASVGSPGTPIPDRSIVMVEAGGERYYFGDRINGYLLHQQGQYAYPFWGFVAAAALQAGMPQADMPDLNDMFAHISRTVGTPDFGIPRAAKDHPTKLTPRQALERFWPGTKHLLSNADGVLVRGMHGMPPDEARASVPVAHWPLIMGLVARQYIAMAKGALDPRTALSLMMESAITMSKVDPKTVPQTPPS
jgi:hypothetical protein